MLNNKQGKYVQVTFMIVIIMFVTGYALFTAPSNTTKEDFLSGFSIAEDANVNVASLKESTETAEEILSEVNKESPSQRNVYEFDNVETNVREDIVGDAGLGTVTGFAIKKKCGGKASNVYLSGGIKDPQNVCVEFADKDKTQKKIFYKPEKEGKKWVIIPENTYVITGVKSGDHQLLAVRADGLLVPALPAEYSTAKNAFVTEIQQSFSNLFTATTTEATHSKSSPVAPEPAKPSLVGVPVEGTGGLGLLKLEDSKIGHTENSGATKSDDLSNDEYRVMTSPEGPDGKPIKIRQHKKDDELYYTDDNNFLLPEGLVVEMEDTSETIVYRKYDSSKGTFTVVDLKEFDAQKNSDEYKAKYQKYQKAAAFAAVKNSLDPTGQFPGYYVATSSDNKAKFAFVDDQVWSEGTIYELKYNQATGEYEKVECKTCDVEEKDGKYYVEKGKEKFELGNKDPWEQAETALNGCVEKIADSKENNEGSECRFVKEQLKAGYKIYSEKFRQEVGKLFGFAVEQADWYQKAKRVPTLWCAAGYNIRTQDGVPTNLQWTDAAPTYWGMDVKAVTNFNVLHDIDPFANIYVYKLFAGKREEVTPTLYRYSFSMSLAGAMVYEVYLINSCTSDRSDDTQGGFIYQGSLGANGVDRQHFATDQLIFDCSKGACRFNYACVDMFLSQDSTEPDGRLCMPLNGGLHGNKFETATEEDQKAGSNDGKLAATDCSDADEVQNKALPVNTICDIWDDPKEEGLEGCQ